MRRPLPRIWERRGSRSRTAKICRANGIIFQNVEGAALDRLTNGENHQGVAAYTAQMKLWEA
ncbi:RNA methyltransferase substrate-binding domain-containing protein, partial [Cloacibacillus evryensis]|uniref:RNA methyltransferase substrate-binding domain-containing protein n=1 Tax=Cloacibacillus evryensis TaxID=508460 RepID=UPI0027E0DB24